MTLIQETEQKLKTEDSFSQISPYNNDSIKPYLTKFTFFITSVPSFVAFIVFKLLKWNLIYALIFVFVYNITIYWILETRFSTIVHLAKISKNFVSNFINHHV